MMTIESYIQGKWARGEGPGRELFHAVTGEKIGEVSTGGFDFKAILDYARTVGGPPLRKMTFHERARMLKKLALYLNDRKEEFYEVSRPTGATKLDAWFDIDGGIGTLFVYASKGRREVPDLPFFVDGPPERISKQGTFVGRHICVPLEGAALHINAFNFPCWGMLEKLAPTLLAGVPAIVKPATVTCYVAERVVRAIIESGILPEGALQLICGSVGDLFEHLTSQDVVTFTGSASTGLKLRSHPNILANAIRFNMEADSLNCSILGPDATPESEEFSLFIREVVNELTAKTGQRCTAIRRTIVPKHLVEPVLTALKKKLSQRKVGNPALEGVKMGPLVSKDQVEEVRQRVGELMKAAKLVYGDWDSFQVEGAEKDQGAFFPYTVLFCERPLQCREPHEVEAFGPVTTVMPYDNVEEAIELAKMGKGSLVGSLFTADNDVACQIVLGTAAYHGRWMIVNRDCAKESTGHGSPLPHLVHGGPGRAGGGEELGGIRSVLHYMQRTALQGHPTTLTHICREWIPGAAQPEATVHPFKKYFDDLQIGETLTTHRRTVTEADIVHFAGLSGDYFYAHTDEIAARKHYIFQGRVAHGYFIVSAAAGLFVWPGEGPVLANYGLEELRFLKPVHIGDTIYVKLTVKRKTAKEPREGEPPNGVVEWAATVYNQEDEEVATYTVLTLVARRQDATGG